MFLASYFTSIRNISKFITYKFIGKREILYFRLIITAFLSEKKQALSQHALLYIINRLGQ